MAIATPPSAPHVTGIFEIQVKALSAIIDTYDEKWSASDASTVFDPRVLIKAGASKRCSSHRHSTRHAHFLPLSLHLYFHLLKLHSRDNDPTWQPSLNHINTLRPTLSFCQLRLRPLAGLNFAGLNSTRLRCPFPRIQMKNDRSRSGRRPN